MMSEIDLTVSLKESAMLAEVFSIPWTLFMHLAPTTLLAQRTYVIIPTKSSEYTTVIWCVSDIFERNSITARAAEMMPKLEKSRECIKLGDSEERVVTLFFFPPVPELGGSAPRLSLTFDCSLAFPERLVRLLEQQRTLQGPLLHLVGSCAVLQGLDANNFSGEHSLGEAKALRMIRPAYMS